MNERGFSAWSFIKGGLALALLLYLLYALRSALLFIFVAIIFSVVFSPFVEAIQRWRVRRWSPGRGAAVMILLAMVLAAVSIFLLFAAPPIARDIRQLTHDLPQILRGLQQKVSEVSLLRSIAPQLDADSIRQWAQSASRQVFSVFQGVVKGIMSLVTLLVLTAYFILDGKRAFRWAMKLVPAERRDRLADTLQRSADRMERWLYGQLMLMLILGSSSAIVFGLLGIRYFYALAVFAGLANFVPILGPIATVIVASGVAAVDSWAKLLGVLIFYLAYQQVENAFLTPRIMRYAVDLPGVAVVVALLIGGELGGLLGAIVAVPTAALVATVVNEYFVDKHADAAVPSEEIA
jgi:predicted PurR-regulated permease PerM